MGLMRDRRRPDPDAVIDAELAETTGGDVSDTAALPVRRASAVPEATAIRTLAPRGEGEIAVRTVAVATAGG
ncbi:MAG: hypothetical protein WAO61_00950, partial [Solirubrobacterales bacterium]